MNVTIIDTRPKWMVEEDNFMLCWMRCSLFRHCASRFGSECKRLGGDKIPKIRYGRGGNRMAVSKTPINIIRGRFVEV